MALPNVFTPAVAEQLITRINQLQPTSQPAWGKMNVAQMLAHCNVTYELVYDNKHAKPNFVMKFILKSFIKEKVVNEKPYPKNSPTAPVFKIVNERDFKEEKQKLITYIQKTQQLGEIFFEGKESHSFGELNATQWNNMFYKHLDHHLSQFGV